MKPIDTSDPAIKLLYEQVTEQGGSLYYLTLKDGFQVYISSSETIATSQTLYVGKALTLLEAMQDAYQNFVARHGIEIIPFIPTDEVIA